MSTYPPHELEASQYATLFLGSGNTSYPYQRQPHATSPSIGSAFSSSVGVADKMVVPSAWVRAREPVRPPPPLRAAPPLSRCAEYADVQRRALTGRSNVGSSPSRTAVPLSPSSAPGFPCAASPALPAPRSGPRGALHRSPPEGPSGTGRNPRC